MDNAQIIALVAISISVISIGLVVENIFNLQTTLINLNTGLVEQGQTIKSLNQQQNVSQQIIEEQKKSIIKMQDNITNLTSEIKLLDGTVISLEQRLNQNCLIPEGCKQPTSQTPATFVQGKIGQALSFDGIGDVVTVTNSPTLNFGNTGSFTISTWIKSTQKGIGDSGFGLIIDHRRNNDGTYAGYSIEDNSGIIQARIRDNAAHDIATISTTNVNDNMYHNIVFVVNRTAQIESLYIDNALQDSKNISTVGSIDTIFDLYLGGTAYPNTPIDFYNGIVDQTRIYDKALSQQEIEKLFNESSSSAVAISRLVGEWKFDGNTLDTS